MKPLSLAVWCAAIFLAANLFAHTVALRLVMLGVGVLLVAGTLVRERLQGAQPSINPIPPLWVPFALWAAWAGLSYFWSIEPERTLKEFRNEIVYSAAAFWLCWCVAQLRGAARVILPVVALGAAGACASALYFYFGKGWEAYAQGPHGGAGNHSSAIITLLPCVFVAGWFAWRERSSRTILLCLSLLAVLLLASGYTTLNRMFWLVTTMQFLVIGGLLIRRAHHLARLEISRASVVKAGIAALVILAVGATMVARIQVARTEAQAARSLAEDPRLQLWPEAIDRIAERPVIGYGFGRGMLRAALRKEFDDSLLWHSHSLVLDAALQTGVVGVLLLGALLSLTLWRGWRLAAFAGPASAACGIALLAIVLGMVMRNMTDVLWVRQNALLYWGMVGTLLALGSTSAIRRETPQPAPA